MVLLRLLLSWRTGCAEYLLGTDDVAFLSRNETLAIPFTASVGSLEWNFRVRNIQLTYNRFSSLSSGTRDVGREDTLQDGRGFESLTLIMEFLD